MSGDDQRVGKLREPVGVLKGFLSTLKSSYLLMLVTALFMVDLAILDPLPFFDEIVLFIGTVLVARWKGRQRKARLLRPAPKDVTPPDGDG